MKNYSLTAKNKQDHTAPKFTIEIDGRNKWLWMIEHLGEPLKDRVLLGLVTETKRGWTCITHSLTHGGVKLFYDRQYWKAEQID